ncbi:MAG: Xaa-Pro peptidase family protein [Desulfovibrionaceae bacterium]|nr:Xaa-Pro peptidase family protein [Desulfovibrionaceae bacterium]
MFEALATVPKTELRDRWQRCRAALAEVCPRAGGLLVFSRVNIYYLSGTLGQGVLWLPVSGEPVLMLRKGLERGLLESGLERVVGFRSFADLVGLAREAGCPLSRTVAVERSGLSWQLGGMLEQRLKDVEFLPGDEALALARARKSEWELSIMRLAGERHHRALHDILPGLISPGMSEREISHLCWRVFFSLGHQGLMRMQAPGEEIFLGHVSAGDSGNYPSSFNGPLGLRGEHPAVPQMGYAGRTWERDEPLAMDVGFLLEGYHTDKTQVFWSGGDIPEAVLSAHSFCMDVQAWLAENARPGARPSELYAHCLEWAEAEGFAEGFMGLAGNKVSFVGHGIGLHIDEYPALARGFDRPLETGMVLALEPKHGLPGLGMVGVENTFEVTDSGAVCITGRKYDMIRVG